MNRDPFALAVDAQGAQKGEPAVLLKQSGLPPEAIARLPKQRRAPDPELVRLAGAVGLVDPSAPVHPDLPASAGLEKHITSALGILRS